MSWAVRGELEGSASDRFAPVRLTISALNLVVGVLFLLRARARQRGSVRAILVALPSALLGGFAFRLAPPVSAWPVDASAVFVVGGILAAVSLLWLGRSFAILPAVRAIQERGPYRIVRHPAYAGELIMVSGSALARRDAIGAIIAVVTAGFVVARIRVEEALLSSSETYAGYARRTPHRLLPFVW